MGMCACINLHVSMSLNLRFSPLLLSAHLISSLSSCGMRMLWENVEIETLIFLFSLTNEQEIGFKGIKWTQVGL